VTPQQKQEILSELLASYKALKGLMSHYETLTDEVEDAEANIAYYNKLIKWAQTPWGTSIEWIKMEWK